MDFGAAFTYIFEDRNWVEKMVMTVVVAVLSFVPLLGLMALAALLGFVVEVVQNVRSGERHPLPRWDNLGHKMTSGGSVLVAGIVYNLPLLMLSLCILVLSLGVAGNSDFFNTTLVFVLACCAVPLLIVYSLVTWPMLALGTARYAETGSIGVFFQFGDLFYTLYRDLPITGQWVLFSVLAGLVIGLLNVIPCLGWIASAALIYPVQAHLVGQFARLIEDKPKARPRRV